MLQYKNNTTKQTDKDEKVQKQMVNSYSLVIGKYKGGKTSENGGVTLLTFQAVTRIW